METAVKERETQVPTPTHGQPTVYPIQAILLPSNKLVSELYIRVLSGYADFDDEKLMIDKETKVSFNTYFNSFYESYWAECTDLTSVQLAVEFTGEIVIEIYRDALNLGCNLIDWKRVKSRDMAVSTITIPIVTSGDAVLGGFHTRGRVFFDVTARKKTKIRSMRFQTTTAPPNRPMLTLGICTFNREPYLYKNLLELEKFAQDTHSIVEIILVNQGEPFVSNELKNLVSESANIRLIEQENLGGCGGFTRTMYESLASEGASHHVLMDDDAQMDARILANLEYFLSHLTEDIVVGGHMLDLYQPWMLCEAGAMVRSNSRIRPLHRNIDLRRTDALHPFLRFHATDYNAWWFCAIPIRHIKAADFPAPIFIRGDDVEYGVRLQEMGVRTVAMPGIAVWHEPFYAKVGGWQVYYDYRNRMIMASMYPHRFTMESPGMMTWAFFRALALHNYQEAALISRAMEDFLAGPTLFDEGADILHARVSALAKTYVPTTAGEHELFSRVVVREMPTGRLRISGLLFKRLATVFLNGNGSKRPTRLSMDGEATIATIGNFPYVKTNNLNTYRLLYTPHRKHLNHLLWRGTIVLLAYLKNRKSASSKWCERIPDLRGRDSWEQIFQKSANSQ